MKKLIWALVVITLITAAGITVYKLTKGAEPWKTYENKTVGITFQYPGDYIRIDHGDEAVAICDKEENCENGKDLEVVVHANKNKITPKEFAEKTAIYACTNKTSEDFTIDGIPSTLFECQSTKTSVKGVITTLKNGSLLEFGIGYESKDSDLFKIFDKILETLQITN